MFPSNVSWEPLCSTMYLRLLKLENVQSHISVSSVSLPFPKALFQSSSSCACVSRWPICLIMAALCSLPSSWLFGVGRGFLLSFLSWLCEHLLSDTNSMLGLIQTLLEFKSMFTTVCPSSCFDSPLNSFKCDELRFQYSSKTLCNANTESSLCSSFVSE